MHNFIYQRHTSGYKDIRIIKSDFDKITSLDLADENQN